ncbi:uncharacterized protein LOC119737461 [Patiria miniata]|uniref:Uncharacterized protein n=1 Tax=Patiria miniata TaxID=46514 RepID=A0A914AW86_PATMI|nr:uncharacterized protein LOC119737461 [Patiria miniata]
MLMDTLEVCLQDNYRSDSENEVRNFLNFLHKQLMHHDLLRLGGPRSNLRGTQSTPNSPLMQRRSSSSTAPADASSSPSARGLRLSTDLCRSDSTAKKVCRAALQQSSDEVEDMMCTGNGDSPTLEV